MNSTARRAFSRTEGRICWTSTRTKIGNSRYTNRATEEAADTLPVELEGEGPTWAGPFLFDGLGQARGTHEGQGNFIVEILPQEGLFSELVFNELDQFEGETTFDIDGIGYVTVEAAGPWSVTME